MRLLTLEIRAALLINGRNRGADHVPVVKVLNPFDEAVWVATELDEDRDNMFGLADLGYPELGSFSLMEISSIRLPWGIGIERDLLFTGLLPISFWAQAARQRGSIRAAEQVVHAAARAQL